MAGADDLTPDQRDALDAVVRDIAEAIGPLMMAPHPASAETWSHAIAEAFGVTDADVQVTLTPPEHAEIAVRTPRRTPEIMLTISKSEEDTVTNPLPTPDTEDWQPPFCGCNIRGAVHPIGHHAFCRWNGSGPLHRAVRGLARLYHRVVTRRG